MSNENDSGLFHEEQAISGAAAALVTMLRERGAISIPLIEHAKALRVAVAHCGSARELLAMTEIQAALLTAAGVSDAELQQCSDEDKVRAVRGLVEKVLIPADAHFVDELIYRFLLVKGERFKSSTANLSRVIAARRLARGIAAALHVRSMPLSLRLKGCARWELWDSSVCDVPLAVEGIAWVQAEQPRLLLFNPELAQGSEVDVAVFAHDHAAQAQPAQLPPNLIGLGVIQPESGTADRSGNWAWHQDRLTNARNRWDAAAKRPYMFFVGTGAEETADADTWFEVQQGSPTRAANGRNAAQLGALCQWIVAA
jgi:hypothetical protein